MKSNINFNREKALEILSKLEEKRKKLNDTYNEIEKESLKINGENKNWEGQGQTKFYNSYKSIAVNFKPINEDLETANDFFKKAIESYTITEEKINNSINNNEESIDIN